MGSPSDVIVVGEVLVVRRTDLGWFCEVDGHRVFVANLQVASPSEMPAQGQRGPVALTRVGYRDLEESLRPTAAPGDAVTVNQLA